MNFKLKNATKKTVISVKVSVAENFLSRLIGLMFKHNMDSEEALIFYNAPSIHTFFMNFPIDVVFLDREMEVIRLCAAVKPWQIVSCFNSAVTIELPPGKIAATSLEVGDRLQLTNN